MRQVISWHQPTQEYYQKTKLHINVTYEYIFNSTGIILKPCIAMY